VSGREFFLYAQENNLRQHAEKAGAGGKQSDEERARSVLELSRGSCDPADERQNILRLQCGERLLRNDQLRGANRNFLRRRGVGSED
jgi:hypothetical protein